MDVETILETDSYNNSMMNKMAFEEEKDYEEIKVISVEFPDDVLSVKPSGVD
jgi:hypothetical protein